MKFHEFAAHPAKRAVQHCIAKLSVYNAEWSNLKAICAKYGPIQIVAVEKVPIIPVFEIEGLCQDAQTARALDNAWLAYTQTNPHRPHSVDEALVWGKQFNPFPDIPHNWRF
jgi:hypothetical protein